ncbi:MAG: putative lipid II flippase FtsW [Planctomycetes bacterium]|nr:putative lipid II flippase FtsW [Planctomycetota bacterium]
MRAGQGLLFFVVALLVTGTVMVNSASLTSTNGAGITLTDLLLGRNTWFALASVAALWLGTRMPVDRVFSMRGLSSPVPWIVLAMFLGLVLVQIPGIGREVNGARRWISIGPVGLQPSEIVKWGMPIVIAWHCCRRAGGLGSFWKGFLPPLLFVSAFAGLVALQDLGTAVLIEVVAIAMLIAAGARIWHALLLLPAVLLAVAGLIVTSPYRLNRILAYWDPFADAQGKGYHIIQSMAAITGGGLPGRGLGNGIQKFGYLPEATTDFIYAIVCEELGIGGAIGVLAIFVMLAITGLAIATATAKVKDQEGRVQSLALTTNFESLIATGFTLTVTLQALINAAVVTGLAPTKGIALPLISRGGTGWILTAFSLGMVASIAGASDRRRKMLGSAGRLVEPPEIEAALPSTG